MKGEGPNSVCVLADPYLFERQVRALENAVENTGIDVPLVLVNDPENVSIDPDAKAKASNEGVGGATIDLATEVLRRERAWTVVLAEKKIAERFGSRCDAFVRTKVEDVPCLSGSKIRYVSPSSEGNWSELPPDAVELVEETCDLVVRFGFGLLRGEILSATDYGVLSFHPADIRQYRGLGAPQAWLDGRDVMGVTLQRLSEEIDGGEIVAYRETDVRDCRTLWEVYDRLAEVQADLLTEGITNLRDPSFEPEVPESLGPYYSTSARQTVPFAGKTLVKNVRGRLRRALRN
jgi:methionyl-tRNA formyltransferase